MTALEKAVRRGCSAWRAPKRVPLSEWADEHAYLSRESSAVYGKFHCLPYQRAIFDAFTDPRVETLTLMKSSRVGGTKLIDFAIAYRIAQDPRPILVVQPTIKAAMRFSKIELNPMFRDTPALQGKVRKAKSRDTNNTLLQKDYIGGSIFLVGANSSTDLSGLTIGDVFLDEEDRYPEEADKEGDPSELAMRRSDTYPNRKIVRVSSPADKQTSKIEPSFLKGDRRYYYVPCPFCGSMRPLIFQAREGRVGHTFEWPEDHPEKAFFRCADCKAEILEKYKRKIVEKGEWIATKPFSGHASFHIWAAYSFSPNARWSHIALAFLEAKDRPSKLKVFVNTWLGETWTSQGEAPDWHRLYERREQYLRGIVPHRARGITAAGDVHPDRIEVDIRAWGAGLENWGIDYRVFYGETDSISSPIWHELDELLVEQFCAEDGRILTLARFGIDCGFNTQVVTTWVKRKHSPKVVALKGSPTERSIVGHPKTTEYTLNGKRMPGSINHYPVGVSLVKSEIYGWFRQPAPTEENPIVPVGFTHFSVNIHNEEYFKQLTAERFETTILKNGRTKYEWVKEYKRNEALDVFVYNRVLAYQLGVDRWKASTDPVPHSQSGRRQEGTVTPSLPKESIRPASRTERARSRLLSRRPRRIW